MYKSRLVFFFLIFGINAWVDSHRWCFRVLTYRVCQLLNWIYMFSLFSVRGKVRRAAFTEIIQTFREIVLLNDDKIFVSTVDLHDHGTFPKLISMVLFWTEIHWAFPSEKHVSPGNVFNCTFLSCAIVYLTVSLYFCLF